MLPGDENGAVNGADPQVLCADHIVDVDLKSIVLVMNDKKYECELCGKADAVEVAPLSELFEAILQTLNFIYGTSDDELLRENEGGNYHGPDMTAADVVRVLCGQVFSDDVSALCLDIVANAIENATNGKLFTNLPALLDTADLVWKRDKLTELVKEESRFVIVQQLQASIGPVSRTPSPPVLLGRLLGELVSFGEHHLNLVKQLPEGTEVYRGRLVNRRDEIDPPTIEKLGPPLGRHAAANRMSPAGISMFYAAEDVQTAIAEIASHDIKPMAMMGTFQLKKVLWVLDLTQGVSPFRARSYEDILKIYFLQHFEEALAAPTIPDSASHDQIDYAPTQIVTEYIRWASETPVDGIAFRSSQTSCKNYVFFAGPEKTKEDFDLTEVALYDVYRSAEGRKREA